MSNHFDLFMESKLPSELKRLCEESKLPFYRRDGNDSLESKQLLNLQCTYFIVAFSFKRCCLLTGRVWIQLFRDSFIFDPLVRMFIGAYF